jgi:uncharacterized membrane protein
MLTPPQSCQWRARASEADLRLARLLLVFTLLRLNNLLLCTLSGSAHRCGDVATRKHQMISLALVASVSCATAIAFHGIVSCLPALLMRLIGRKLNIRSNSILHADKRTFRDRTVVIPCPDFLYSTVSVDLTNRAAALLFSAPMAVYASLGVYDDHARCVAIANHSNSPLRALVVGPEVSADDRQLQELFPDTPTRVLRLPSSTGLLLHRYLMPAPDDHTELRQRQLAEVRCEMVQLPSVACRLSSSASLLQSLPVKILLSVLWSPMALILTGPLLASLSSLPSQSSLSLPVLLSLLSLISLLLAITLALLTIVLLKKPSYAARVGAMSLSHIKLWKFNTLEAFGDSPSPSSPSAAPQPPSIFPLSALSPARLADPYRNLVFFLHGALGLTPSEVQYGGTLTVYSRLPQRSLLISDSASEVERESESTEYLRYDGCYAIDVPSLSLCCDWWSITLYGQDLYLLPSPQHRYSVNSHQLLSIHRSLTSALQTARPARPLPTAITYRILSCSEDPQIPALSVLVQSLIEQLDSCDHQTVLHVPVEWIQLVAPEAGGSNSDSSSETSLSESQLEDRSPRFILRGLLSPSLPLWALSHLLVLQPTSLTAPIGSKR